MADVRAIGVAFGPYNTNMRTPELAHASVRALIVEWLVHHRPDVPGGLREDTARLVAADYGTMGNQAWLDAASLDRFVELARAAGHVRWAEHDRVEVWADEQWNPGKITHIGPTRTTGVGPMTLPALGPADLRVLTDAGWTIQAPKADASVLRREGAGQPLTDAATSGIGAERQPCRTCGEFGHTAARHPRSTSGVISSERATALDLGAVIRSVNLDDDGEIVERGANPLRRVEGGWRNDATSTTHEPDGLSGWFVIVSEPWRPVDAERPPDPCPHGCGCRWRLDADRAECGCEGPCRGDDLDAPRADGQAWEQRPDPSDEPPALARDAALPVRQGFAEHRTGHGLTVGHLMAALRDVPPETVIVLASDAEGNGHSPLADIAEALYDPESTWSGETYLRDDRIGHDGYTEEDRAPEGAFPVIELGPVN